MRQHNLRVTGSLSINGENVISASELSALSSSIVSRIEGLNPSQIGTGSYTASILSTGGFTINTDTKITGSLLVSNLSGSGVNYISAVSGGLLVAVSGSNAILNTQRFVATAGQTVFNSSYGYLTGLVQVFYNGTKLDSTEFSDTDGNTITLTTGSNQTGDVVEVVTYRPVSGVEQNALRTKTTFTASASQTTFAVDYTPGLIDVYFNGSHLASEEYTANNGTTIVLTEAATGGEVLDVFVYNNQIGAFSGIGGGGEVGQFAYFSSQSGISGSNVISISGSNIIAGGSIIPSLSGSYDLGSSTKPFRHIYVGTGSIYLVDNQGQVTNTISAQTIVTTDTLNSASIDLTKSLPAGTVSSSAQIVGILSALNSFTASNSTTNTFTTSTTARLNAIETISASNLNRLTSLENKTGSLATTGSNTFYGTQTISGAVYIANDLIVQGSSSIQNITGSSVNIGTNTVVLNTANPAVRYAGISVIDSGSTGLTGSILWDSTNNNWLYQNPSGSSYTSAKFISGPQSQTLGSELGLVTNFLVKAIADDHISSSAIFDNGTTIGLKSNTEVTGSFSILGDGAFINRTTSGEPYVFFRKNGVNRGSIYGVDGGGLRIFDNNDVQVLTITSSFVGINTSTPGQQLEIRSADGQGIRFKNLGSSDKRWDLVGSGNDFRINETGVGAVACFRAGGNIGIGTTTPVSKLDIYPTTSSDTIPGFIVSGSGWGSISNAMVRFDGGPASDGNVLLLRSSGNNRSDSEIFEVQNTGNNTVFVIKGNGNVAIGTSTPDAVFHVAKSNAGGVGGQVVIDNNASSTLGNAAEISFLTDAGASGAATRNARIIAVSENAGNGAANMQFHTWSGGLSEERMRVTSTGTIFNKQWYGNSLSGGYSLIGTISPGNTGDRYLHVKFNTVGSMMVWIKVLGYSYVSGVIEGLCGGYIGGGTGGVNQGFQTGSIVAQYQNGGYLEVVVDTVGTGTTNRWGSITFFGGTDTITTIQALEFVSYSWTSTTTRVY